ncbi:hypothetical protein PMIN04_003289 [Paraphaeosphaeria minitans]
MHGGVSARLAPLSKPSLFPPPPPSLARPALCRNAIPWPKLASGPATHASSHQLHRNVLIEEQRCAMREARSSKRSRAFIRACDLGGQGQRRRAREKRGGCVVCVCVEWKEHYAWVGEKKKEEEEEEEEEDEQLLGRR